LQIFQRGTKSGGQPASGGGSSCDFVDGRGGDDDGYGRRANENGEEGTQDVIRV
jgi:hypothetical protein